MSGVVVFDWAVEIVRTCVTFGAKVWTDLFNALGAWDTWLYLIFILFITSCVVTPFVSTLHSEGMSDAVKKFKGGKGKDEE